MQYFTLDELTRSATAARLGINNQPPYDVQRNLTALIDNILDPARRQLGQPIIVSSGYRSPRLNRAVGGARQSQHLTGHAADLYTLDDQSLRRLIDILRRLPYDQLILERCRTQHDLPQWIHVSYDPARNRHQQLWYDLYGHYHAIG